MCRSNANEPSSGFLAGWLSPVYLWLAFLSLQPHKEERFMFVVYPLLGQTRNPKP